MAKIYAIDREGDQHVLDGDVGTSVMKNLRDNDLPVLAECGGVCSCATCHVFVDEAWYGQLKAPDDEEIELLSGSDHYQPGVSRLSCQIKFSAALDGIRVTLAPED